MRPFVIITIQTENKELNYDIEAPTDVLVSCLKEDILEAIYHYNPKHRTIKSQCSLYCSRLKREISDGETFGSAGIWTGDIIVLK